MASIMKRIAGPIFGRLIEQRVSLAILMAVAIGKMLVARYPLPAGNTLVLYIAQERPDLYAVLPGATCSFCLPLPL